jgi:hypothetical protein
MSTNCITLLWPELENNHQFWYQNSVDMTCDRCLCRKLAFSSEIFIRFQPFFLPYFNHEQMHSRLNNHGYWTLLERGDIVWCCDENNKTTTVKIFLNDKNDSNV